MSEDEGLPLDPPTFVHLFKPAVFHFLLFKAKKVAGIPAPKAPQGMDPDKTDTTDPLFIQPNMEKEVIPSPRLFIDVVQN